MDLGLTGKVALVAGGGDGIGYGIADLLAREGARVAVFGGDPGVAKAVERLRRDTGGDVLAAEGDCERAEDIARAVSTVVEQYGGIDVLVIDNEGSPAREIESLDDVAWQGALNRRFFYVVRLVREVLPHLKEHGGGIVNVVGSLTVQPETASALSVAMWAAIVGYGKTLSKEMGTDSITVNTLFAGQIELPDGRMRSSGAERTVASVPLGRLGTTAEVASAVALLASERGRFINGAALHVDGGESRIFR